MGQALPLATRIVISIVEVIRDYGIWILLVLIFLGFYLCSLLRNPEIRLRWDRWSMAEVIGAATSSVTEDSRLAEPLLEGCIFQLLATQMILTKPYAARVTNCTVSASPSGSKVFCCTVMLIDTTLGIVAQLFI